MFSDALIEGMGRSLIRSATASFLGDGQIHGSGYREMPELETTIEDSQSLVRKLGADDRIAHFTERVLSFAMITSPANLAAVQLVGINPATEAGVSQVDDAIREGTFFQGTDPRDIVIGNQLAENLEVGIGDRVVVTVAQAKTGELSQEMFRVTGIFRFNVPDMDRGTIFIRIEKAQDMLNLGPDIHEIAVTLKDPSFDGNQEIPLWKDYSTAGNEAAGWPVLLPQLKMVMDLSQFSLAIMGLILFAIVALGILNTLFMSLHERMFEFGVLRAVGTRPGTMAGFILAEAAALAVVALVLGIALGTLAIAVFAHYGLDYTGIEAMGVTFRELLYPVFRLQQFTLYPAAVFFSTLLIGLYPAVHAARLEPADAMRRSF